MSAGTLLLAGVNGVPSTSNLTVSSGTFDVSSFNDTVAGVQLTGGLINGTTGILTSLSAFDMENGNVTAILNGTVGLNKTTTGTITLSGLNTYTGNTSVSAGILAVGATNSVPSTSNVTVSGGNFSISLFNDTVAGVQLTGGTINGTTGTLASLSTFDMQNGTSTAILGGTVGLNKTTGGTVTLFGNETFTGITNVSAGTLNMNGTLASTAVIVDGGLMNINAGNSVASTSTISVSSGNFNLSSFSDTVSGVQLTGGIIAGTTGTLVSTSAYDMENGTVSAILGGTIGLNKTTSGTVTLTGNDTYTGTTSVIAGTLNVDGTLASTLISVSNTGLFNFGANNILLNTANVSVSGGNFNIGTFNDTVAGVQLTGGTIAGTTGTLTSLSAYDMENGTVSAILGGTVGLNKTTNGTVNLNGNDTYTGTTNITAGTLNVSGSQATSLISVSSTGLLNLGADNVFAGTANVTVSGGNFNIGTFNDTVAGVQLTGGAISGTTGTLTSLSAFDMENGTVTAILNGTAGLNKTTSGTVTLDGVNTYSGTANISAGTLALGVNNALAATSNVSVTGGNFSIGTFNDTVAGVQLTGGVISGTTGTLTSLSAYDMESGTVNAILGGAVGLNKTTSGTVTLNGVNTFNGTTSVSAGTLVIGVNNSLAATSNLTVSGGNFSVTNLNDTVAGVQLTGGIITGTTGTLTSDSTYDMQNGAVTAILGGTVGLNKTTGGTVTLGAANTYQGATNVTAGTLSLGISNGVSSASNLYVSGGNFNISNFSDLVNGVQLTNGGTIAGTNGTLTSLTAFDMQNGNVSAILGGSVGLNKTTTGTVTLTGVNSYTGTTTVSAGTLALGVTDSLALTSSLVVSGGTLNVNTFADTVGSVQLTGGNIINGPTGTLISTTNYDMENGNVSAILGGTVGLNKTTGGTVTLGAVNLYSGTTSVSAGTLVVGINNSVSSTSNVTVSGGNFSIGAFNDTVAALQLTGGAITGTTGTLTSLSAYDMENGTDSAILGGTVGLNKTTTGTVTLSGVNTYTGLTSVSAGTLALGVNNSLAAASNLSVSGGNFNIGTFNDTVAGVQLTGGTITGTTGTLTSSSAFDLENGTVTAILGGTLGANKTTTGTVTLSGVNTYTGLTTVSAGTLDLSGSGTLGATTATLTVNGGTLDLGGTSPNSLGTVTFNGGTVQNGTLTSSVNYVGQSGTVSAVLAGSVGLGMTGPGTLTLSGSNLYTGTTSVSAGTLNLNGTLTSTNILVSGTGLMNLNANNLLSGSANVSVSGGNFNIGTFNDTVAGVQLTGGTIAGSTGTLTSTSPYDMENGNVTANLGGGAALNKTTSGTVTLNGSDSYTGATNVSAGTLNLNAALASTVITVNGTGLLNLDANNLLSGSANVSVSASGNFNIGNFNDTMAGVQLLGGTISGLAGTLTSTAPMTCKTAPSAQSSAAPWA